jgi:hypothetical protein
LAERSDDAVAGGERGEAQSRAPDADPGFAYAKAHRHPELAEQMVREVFEAERLNLVPYAGRFDGFHAVPASVSKTCLVRFDNNKYSVTASAVGRPVEVHAYADRIVIRQDGRIVAEHPRSFGRGETTYDPWHYVPWLASRAPCATALPSRTGYCRQQLNVYDASSPAPTTAASCIKASSSKPIAVSTPTPNG